MTATQQCMDALARANEVRIRRAQLKNRIRDLPSGAGARLVAAVITERYCEPAEGGISVLRLLMCIRRFGEGKASMCLIAAGIRNFERSLFDLSDAERDAIAGQLVFWACGRH